MRHALVVVATAAMIASVVGCGTRAQRQYDRQRRADSEVDLGKALFTEGNPARAIEHLHAALELVPDHYEAYKVLGVIHFQMNELDTAESEFRRALELRIAMTGEPTGNEASQIRTLLGATLNRQQRYEEAVEPLRAAANDELNHDPLMSWGNLGIALVELGRYDEAVPALIRSVEIGPRFCVGYYYLGRAYVATESWEDAEVALARAVEADPTCATSPSLQNAWRLRGEVRARLGYQEDARSDYERCVELGPESPDGLACQRSLDAALDAGES